MKVEPIIDLKTIKSIKKILSDNPRDKLLFVMGVNSGLRVQDLLALTVGDVKDVKTGDRITLREKKTGKENVFILNKEIKSALDVYLGTVEDDSTHFLFKSRKGKNYPLTTYAVTKYMKKWTEAINLKGNYGCHSLRKTWTYHQRREFGVSWEVLAKRLNHSSPSVTRRYMGVQDEEVEQVLMNTL